jgi:hypothetical protein
MRIVIGWPDGYFQIYWAFGKYARCLSFKKGYEWGLNPYRTCE